jgi:hypothetical protein
MASEQSRLLEAPAPGLRYVTRCLGHARSSIAGAYRAHLIDSPLQEIIEHTTLQQLRKGHTILDLRSGMKPKKRILSQQRLRRIPGQFSWIDQRLVRDRYLQQCDHGALALYLVLVTVSEVEGLSYYSEASLERMLNMEAAQLLSARDQLIRADLIVYDKPYPVKEMHGL